MGELDDLEREMRDVFPEMHGSQEHREQVVREACSDFIAAANNAGMTVDGIRWVFRTELAEFRKQLHDPQRGRKKSDEQRRFFDGLGKQFDS